MEPQMWGDDNNDQDNALVCEQIQNELNDKIEDHKFHHIAGYKWDEGSLIFKVELCSGKSFEVPFNLLSERSSHGNGKVHKKQRCGK